MSYHTPRSLISVTAVFMLVAGCESSDPPKLTGMYSLESAQSAEWTGGSTLTPPAVTGTLLINQARFEQGLAYGHAQLELTHSSGSGIRWTGSYSNGTGGVLFMRLNDVRYEGQYDFDDGTLTMDLSGEYSGSGPSPVGTLVWKQDSEES